MGASCSRSDHHVEGDHPLDESYHIVSRRENRKCVIAKFDEGHSGKTGNVDVDTDEIRSVGGGSADTFGTISTV
eukprot:CAMPEP_0168192468 /NCGR_PEP_ID=MMETSP0139_2-20121125/18064_1 /TAXON_ID=44445 /ORGANISM="Pseudo-nitzschia australis, Strain 10249 10 AB" /LENGTH=73 /DNA_ID=CAMNT_0008115709 /DNA_START=282 /DNA_END=503 /DNA_ORIENTATION=+